MVVCDICGVVYDTDNNFIFSIQDSFYEGSDKGLIFANVLLSAKKICIQCTNRLLYDNRLVYSRDMDG